MIHEIAWKGLGVGRFLLRIDLGDGVMRTVVLGLS